MSAGRHTASSAAVIIGPTDATTVYSIRAARHIGVDTHLLRDLKKMIQLNGRREQHHIDFARGQTPRRFAQRLEIGRQIPR